MVTNWDSFLTEDPLYNVTVCGRRRYFLYARECSNKNPIQLISVRYVQCTCACEACETMHVPDACVPRDVLNKISEECEGKAWCRVRRPHVSCDFGYKTAIRITYSCHTRNNNYEEDEEENDRRGGRRQRHWSSKSKIDPLTCRMLIDQEYLNLSYSLEPTFCNELRLLFLLFSFPLPFTSYLFFLSFPFLQQEKNCLQKIWNDVNMCFGFWLFEVMFAIVFL